MFRQFMFFVRIPYPLGSCDVVVGAGGRTITGMSTLSRRLLSDGSTMRSGFETRFPTTDARADRRRRNGWRPAARLAMRTTSVEDRPGATTVRRTVIPVGNSDAAISTGPRNPPIRSMTTGILAEVPALTTMTVRCATARKLGTGFFTSKR